LEITYRFASHFARIVDRTGKEKGFFELKLK